MKLINVIEFIKVILRGVGQVMLQNNAATGLIFLAGIFYNSWLMGLGALIGVFAGTIIAFIMGADKKDIQDGLYGFNGTLVGIALLFLFKISILMIILIILGSMLSSILMRFMHERRWFPYTFPFVASTWILVVLIWLFDAAVQRSQTLAEARNLGVLSSLSMGFGQVMFQASMITGIIFLIAIIVNSRKSAIYAVIGSSIGLLVALMLSLQLDLINIGIFGFNGVLCCIAFADKRKYSLFYAVIAAIVSVFIMQGFLFLGLIALTAPFVFSTWIISGLRNIISKRIKT